MQTTLWDFRAKDNISAILSGINNKIGLLDKNVTGVEKSTSGLSSHFSSLHQKNIGKLDDLAMQFPVIGTGMAALANPVTAVAAGIAATVAVLGKGVEKAAAYNTQFLELQNLNLDKTTQQIATLNESVLSTAFDTGTSAKDMAQAYFNVQSATGKYGEEVDFLTARIAKFSSATRSDFITQIDASSKAMVNFGIESKDIDRLLIANAKTVQLGITTFGELATVQTEYAGAAKGANQEVETANKLFAVFTQSAKNVDIAATLTKSAFEGFADQRVIKGLGKFNVGLFDTGGNMRSVQDIITDLNPLISKMSDQDFSKFMGAVGGGEGMRVLLQRIRGDGDKVLEMFTKFDKTEFSIEKAAANAGKNFDNLSSQLSSKFEVIMIRLGNTVMPLVIGGMNALNVTMDAGVSIFTTIYNAGIAIDNAFGGMFSTIISGLNPFTRLNNLLESGGQMIDWVKMQLFGASEQVNVFSYAGIFAAQILDKLGLGFLKNIRFVDTFKAGIAGVVAAASQLLPILQGVGKAVGGAFTFDFDKIEEGIQIASGGIANLSSGKFLDSFTDTYNSKLDELSKAGGANSAGRAVASTLAPPSIAKPSSTATPPTSTPSAITSSIAAATGIGGGGGKNVTVNIDKLVENITIQSTHTTDVNQIRTIIEQTLVQAVNDSENMF